MTVARVTDDGTTADTAHQRIRLDSLTSMRFFAAGLVLVHHAFYRVMPGSPFAGATHAGFVGVGFFFTLSGFVLMWSYSPGLRIRHFYGRRVARVYPMHLFTAVVSLVLVLAWGGSVAGLPAGLNVLLLHSWVPIERYGSSLNGVSWSLCCEAFFYAMFPFLAARAVRWNLRVAASVICGGMLLTAVGVALIAPVDVAQQILYKGPEFRIGGFMLGILIAVALERGTLPRLRIVTAVAFAALSYLAALHAPGVAHAVTGLPRLRVFADIATLPASCLLIAAAAHTDLARVRSVLRHRWLVRLGEASFALYLTHYLLIETWMEYVGLPSGTGLRLGTVALLCALAVGVSLAAYWLVERPIEARLRASIGRPRRLDGHERGQLGRMQTPESP